VLVLGSSAGVTSALIGDPPVPEQASPPVAQHQEIRAAVGGPEALRQLSAPPPPAPLPEPPTEAVTGTQLCDDPDIVAALAAGDDAAVIAAAGGAEPFRVAVSAGAAPCIRLDDPARVWSVVNKLRPYAPIDYAPEPLVVPEGVRSVDEATLRADAAAALSAMVAAAGAAGVGELAIESAYRSYQTQHSSYGAQVSMRGTEQADLVSARPGHSEHQSGLAVDVIPCDGECRTIDDLAASPQGAWVAQHSWEHGWIVRYVEGATGVSGYLPEPWHLRYIGPDLARAYHDGGWTTLEEFFGLPAAPTYAG
jgi:D-alanyl-D-alanine carboxypeptidase